MTSSTMSSESAPRSSMNEASGVTSSSLTPSCSQTISLTLASTDDAIRSPPLNCFLRHQQPAVHADHLAGDIPGRGTGEKRDCAGDVFAAPEPPQRYRLQKFLL